MARIAEISVMWKWNYFYDWQTGLVLVFVYEYLLVRYDVYAKQGIRMGMV